MEPDLSKSPSAGPLPSPAPEPGTLASDRYETDVVLKNGSTLHLRPVRPEDAPRLLEFIRGLSPESLYLRFLSVPNVDLARAEYLAQVDYANQFALVGETRHGIVALGHFFRDPERPDRAEAAFAVADALHGQGIGTSLLDRLARVALEMGIRTFEAEVLPYNRKMIDVFVSSGFDVRQRAEDGVVWFEISLEPTTTSVEKAAERARHAATASMQAFFEPRTVAVVDYGMGNLRSVSQAVMHAAQGEGVDVIVTSSPEQVRAAERVVLPGQGAMRDCMRELRDSGLEPAVLEAAAANGAIVAYPAFADHQANFRFLAGDPSEIGPWACFQPPLDAPEVFPDLVLVPLVAIDGKGTRLGQGKGHYDRVLGHQREHGALLIGVGWDVQKVEANIPAEPWDVQLDGFASPAGLEMFR